MKRMLVDTNVILRYFTKKPADMAEAARATFFAAQRGDIRLVIAPIVVAEVVWVLESFYKYSKEKISAVLKEFLHADGLEVMERDHLIEALVFYAEKNIDFTDAMLAVTALKHGTEAVCSFDTHFDRVPGISRYTPGDMK